MKLQRIQLQDIIDLDILMDRDEKALIQGKSRELSLRDRNIHKHITAESKDPSNHAIHTLHGERSLIMGWLSRRRQEIKGQNDENPLLLPGALLETQMAWANRLIYLAGGISGMTAAYSFLAYHGFHPVNVALFFVLFALIPFLTNIFTLIAFICHFFSREDKSRKSSAVPFRITVFRSILQGLSALLEKILPDTWAPGNTHGFFELLRQKNTGMAKKYIGLLFWPMMGITSGFSLCFSLGALLGTLFRISTADLAFGWQSTLTASARHIHELVSAIALPWSWLLPQIQPTQLQIQGSRIILKQGIESLASEHLASWWPFLCMAIICYAILPRFILLICAKIASFQALNRYDFSNAKFRSLLIRMQSPFVDVEYEKGEKPNTQQAGITAQNQPPTPPPKEIFSGRARGLLLAPESICTKEDLGQWAQKAEEKLRIPMEETMFLSMDPTEDKARIAPLLQDQNLEILILQEVWQPPIRGLLYYYTQLADKFCNDNYLWILLISRMDNGETSSNHKEQIMDEKIWRMAIQKLNQPRIMVDTLELKKNIGNRE